MRFRYICNGYEKVFTSDLKFDEIVGGVKMKLKDVDVKYCVQTNPLKPPSQVVPKVALSIQALEIDSLKVTERKQLTLYGIKSEDLIDIL